MSSHPPERTELDLLLLRRSTPDDAELVAAAVALNLQHLKPWLPWASPAAAVVENQHKRLIETSLAWDSGSGFEYLALQRDELVGGFGLHRRVGPNAVELGYWLCEQATGRGHATAAVEALTRAALGLTGTRSVEIRCDQANDRSQGVPLRLGYRLLRIEPDAVKAPAEVGQSMIWVFPPHQQ